MPFSSGKFRAEKVARVEEHVDVLEEYKRLTGYEVGDPCWEKAIHVDDRAAVMGEWAKAKRTGTFLCEYRLRFRDGHFHRVIGFSRRRYTLIGREVWKGYIVRVNPDHVHVCTEAGTNCYCCIPVGLGFHRG